MPDTDNPRIEKWIPKIAEVVGTADGETYFVGHSMGCQAIARYLETLPENIKVGGAIFVAGFFKRLTGLENKDKKIEKHWMSIPPDLEKVKLHLTKNVAIFSDDDPYVPLDNVEDFKEKLNSRIIILRNRGHINDDSGITGLPLILEELLKITK